AAARPINLVTQRDVDEYDAMCDHVLIVDKQARAKWPAKATVATCRLLRQEIAERHGGFYTAGEYRIEELVARHSGMRFLELGRSCVSRPYRSKRTVELLWHGIWSYVLRHRMEVLVGCASFEGTDPDKLALSLSYLHHYASAPEPW